MTEVHDLTQKIYDLDEDVLKASLSNLAEEMGGDLTGNSAPRGFSVGSIDFDALARTPISQGAVEFGQKIFAQVNTEAYQILCTPMGDKNTKVFGRLKLFVYEDP
ncbi:hypothetical protein [Argonema antarcticum]|uniref:hypothetical protein n=1 Tax=Argonema antarcticum TaxID=2942763 RepID=UPI00201120D9|nr:hypothetical protein [Argonema antarcticum]MCL1470028.1 hypothetical protein [Argonema antarcticum A004/B2]